MKNRRLVFIMVLAVGMTVSVFGQRRDGSRGMMQGRGYSQEWISKSDRFEKNFASNLSDDQKASIKEIRLNCSKETKPLTYKLKELKAKHQTLINADKPDMKAINSNIDEMTKIENQLTKIRAKTKVDVLSKLTDDQKLMYSDRRSGKRMCPRGDW